MIYASGCAGIEAASQAWEPLGWKPAWFSEIEPFPCSVLAHHYPNVPNLGDFTALENNEYVQNTPLDLFVAGTPCQGFSVAGLRKGLADDRSNLALSYVRLVLKRKPRWFLWENVPGAFTTNQGQDFGCFLSGLSGVDVSAPEDGWKTSGIVVGAEGHYGLAWRVLDAQYAGVPQRRRRIFVVGYLGDWRRAAAVLFERESLQWNSPPSRKTREAVATTLSKRTKVGSGLGTAFGGGRTSGPIDVSTTLVAKGNGQRCDFEAETFIAFNLRGREGGSLPEPDDLASMRAASGGSSRSYIAFSCKDSGGDAGELAPTLRAGGHSGSHANAGVMPAIAYDIRNGTHDTTAMSLQSGGMGDDRGLCLNAIPHTIQQMAVRRLTPSECERLQGFPDNYTSVLHRGKPAADGPRYKALGNSMAVPCMRWIGERIQLVDDLCRELNLQS